MSLSYLLMIFWFFSISFLNIMIFSNWVSLILPRKSFKDLISTSSSATSLSFNKVSLPSLSISSRVFMSFSLNCFIIPMREPMSSVPACLRSLTIYSDMITFYLCSSSSTVNFLANLTRPRKFLCWNRSLWSSFTRFSWILWKTKTLKLSSLRALIFSAFYR